MADVHRHLQLVDFLRGHAIRRRPVRHHLRLGQRARVLVRDAVLPDLRRGVRSLLAAAFHRFDERRLDDLVEALLHLVPLLAVSVGARRLQQLEELPLQVRELDAILRPLGSADARADGPQIQLQELRVVAFAFLRDAEETLLLVVRPQLADLARGASRREQVLAGQLVDGEVADGSAVLGRHVGDGRALRNGQGGSAFAMELDELSHHLRLAQHLGDGEDEVGRRDARAQFPGQVHAHHVGREEVDRLAQHRRLGLDPADAPADDTQSVDHRGVRIGSDEGVRIDHSVPLEDTLGEVLQIDLVDDPDAGRDDLEAVEGLHAPLEELVARPVARELDAHVELQRVRDAREVDLHAVVDHEIDRHGRLDQLRLCVRALDRAAHGGQVDDEGHAGEVLQEHARDHERDLLGALGARLPRREVLDVLFAHALAVEVAQQGLEHDAQADGHARDRGELLARRGQGGESRRLPSGAEFLLVRTGHDASLRSGAGSIPIRRVSPPTPLEHVRGA